jgi:hypothetical protein
VNEKDPVQEKAAIGGADQSARKLHKDGEGPRAGKEIREVEIENGGNTRSLVQKAQASGGDTGQEIREASEARCARLHKLLNAGSKRELS